MLLASIFYYIDLTAYRVQGIMSLHKGFFEVMFCDLILFSNRFSNHIVFIFEGRTIDSLYCGYLLLVVCPGDFKK